MKIVFIGCRSIHTLGGIESYMYNLTQELNKLGHECIVWCESDHREVEDLDGVKVIYHPGPKSNLLCKPWCGLKATLRTLFDEKNVSFIHYNAWPASLWNWMPRMCGIPSLMEGHGLEWQRSKYSPKAQKVMKFMEKFTAKTNHHLAMCSEGQVEYFKKEYGVDSVCIPGAVNLPELSVADESNILQRNGLVKGKYFLFMGRLVQDKNPDYLIRAFINANLNAQSGSAKFLNEGHWKLVIAGSNDAMPQYVEKLKTIAHDCDDVIFTGAVYGCDKARLLRDAYCFCLPSTIEGLSIVMMEAASYKLPTIASDIDANREFLKDDAVYVRPENTEDLVEALKFAAENPDKMEQLKQVNYQKILNTYTWDKVAIRYVEYLHSIGVK